MHYRRRLVTRHIRFGRLPCWRVHPDPGSDAFGELGRPVRSPSFAVNVATGDRDFNVGSAVGFESRVVYTSGRDNDLTRAESLFLRKGRG